MLPEATYMCYGPECNPPLQDQQLSPILCPHMFPEATLFGIDLENNFSFMNCLLVIVPIHALTALSPIAPHAVASQMGPKLSLLSSPYEAVF